MSEENTSQQPSSAGQRMGSAFKAFVLGLFRLIVIATILGLIGVVAFYGIPQIYRQTLVPIQNRMSTLEETQLSQAQDIQNLAKSMDEVQQRTIALELNQDTTKQQIDELSSQIEQLQEAQDGKFENLTSNQAAYQETFDEITSSLSQLEEQLKRLSGSMDKINDQITELNNELDSLEERLDTGDAPIVELRRELQIVKVMELLTRSRLFLVENNLGLAEEDIRTARNLLAELPVADFQEEAKTTIIIHLDLALDNLPDSPVLAAENLEIAWQLLKQGLPSEPTSDVNPTETPEPESDQSLPTQTPTPTPTLTPTPSN